MGKGKNNRYKDVKDRNKYFKNYYNKHNCNVRKVKTGMLEKDAFELEKKLINKYREADQCQCNLANGGEGSTFPEGSWNNIFKKLSFLNNVLYAMDEMYNVSEYENESLKTKSLDELNTLYDQFIQHKEGMETEECLLPEKPLDVYELDSDYKGLVMLIRNVVYRYATEHSQYKDILKCSSEVDYFFLEFNIIELIKLALIENNVHCVSFFYEFGKILKKNMRLLTKLQYNFDSPLHINIKSHSMLENGVLRIKFNTDDYKKITTVKIDIFDIILQILVHGTNKTLIHIIYDEILLDPFNI